MAVSIASSGAWKTLLNASIGQSGSWKQATGLWVGDSGAWKFVWAPVTGGDVSDSAGALYPATATAFITWDSDGTFDRSQGSNQFSWLAGGTGSDWEIYLTQSTGDAVTGTLNSWLNLGTDRSLSLSDATAGPEKTAAGAYQIRHAASATIVVSGNWSLLANSEI